MSSPFAKNIRSKILSHLIYTLKQDTFTYTRRDGQTQELKRIVFDRGHGGAVLLYNKEKQTVVLTKQFRYPIVTEKHNGMLIEVCAGLLDNDNPEACVKREAIEETGFSLFNLEKVMEIHPSPGAVTEILYLYLAEYSDATQVNEGGGLEEEGEDIEVMEIPFEKAMQMIDSGEITDAKTIILLQYAALKKRL